jgi:diadenylate cyclase
MSDDALTFDYESSPNIRRLVERLTDCAESLSLGFDGYGEAQIKGPGLYVAVVTGRSVAAYADPMGSNRWPVEDCQSVFGHTGALFEAARSVAVACDGAVVVRSDGTFRPAMVRFTQLTDAEGETVDRLPYADWMGTRHMSALETSTRDAVFAVVTLSEEDGRATVFRDGTYEDRQRDVLDGRW